ncbi:MAG: hypothetical protein HEQ35_12460 [Gloeotrichia echinulata IR180]
MSCCQGIGNWGLGTLRQAQCIAGDWELGTGEEFSLIPHTQCPMPNAQCPIPNPQSPLSLRLSGCCIPLEPLLT